jgi:AcrR family transcriptional regulator
MIRMTRTRKRARPAGLSAERIVTAALRLIDRHGLDEFSTRKLGRALRCEAMAIYYYFPSKDALLDAVVEKLVEPIGAGDGTVAWLEALRRVAHAYRAIAREHPRAFPLLATRRFSSAGSYAFLEQLFALGRAHGISDRQAARVYRAVSSYCNGFALNELSAIRELSDPSIAATRAQFPHVAAVFSWLGPEDADDNFAFGLELLLVALAPAADGGDRDQDAGQPSEAATSRTSPRQAVIRTPPR